MNVGGVNTTYPMGYETKRTQRRLSESEDEFCSLCGSRLKPDGSCPICIVPTFISGNKRSFIQNVSQANSRNLTVPSRNLIQSKNK